MIHGQTLNKSVLQACAGLEQVLGRLPAKSGLEFGHTVPVAWLELSRRGAEVLGKSQFV